MMLDLFPEQLLQPSNHFDQEIRQLADRHYNRQSPGAAQFAPNGPKLVLRDCSGLVYWVWINSPLERWDRQRSWHQEKAAGPPDHSSARTRAVEPQPATSGTDAAGSEPAKRA